VVDRGLGRSLQSYQNDAQSQTARVTSFFMRSTTRSGGRATARAEFDKYLQQQARSSPANFASVFECVVFRY
jgi:hypothetical protein